MIRAATTTDADAIAGIYNHFIVNTIVTFEETAVAAGDIAARMAEVTQASLPWLVTEVDGRVIGYAYASSWKGRCAYRYSAETTVYLDAGSTGRGYGSALYRALLDELAARGIHAAIGGIALPNAASEALHAKLGFTKVAHFREVGYKFNRWIDVAYWQHLLPEAGRHIAITHTGDPT